MRSSKWILGLMLALAGCDGGTTTPDAGMTTPDSGAPRDAGPMDAGTPRPDSGSTPDSGPPPPPVDAGPPRGCDERTLITETTTLTGESLLSGVPRAFDRFSGCANYEFMGPLRYYEVQLGADQQLRFEAQGEGLNLNLSVLPECAASNCSASSERAGDGAAERLVYTNPTGAPQSIVVVVGRAWYSAAATYDVRAEIVDAPAGILCNNPIVVENGTRLTGQEYYRGVDDWYRICDSWSGATVLYYRATVPAGERVTANVTSSRISPVIRIVDGCDRTSVMCLGAGETASGRSASASYTNTTGATRDVLILVTSYKTLVTATFDLAVTIGAP